MKVIRWTIITIVIVFMLLMGIAAPAAFIGLAVFLIGLYLSNQHRKYKINFKKSGWIMAAGFILSIFLATADSDATETVNEPEKEQIQSEENEAEKKAEDEKLAKEKAEEEEAKKQAEEQERLEAEQEEKQKQEEEEKQKQEQVQSQAAESLGLELVTVGRVVDGDTIETSDGRKVRLIGVNTPESTTRVEEYGKEASQFTTSELTGKKIWMQKDVSDTDRYGRLLRIVWLDIPADDMDEGEIREKMFNAHLVLNGYAEPSTYNPDVKYSEYFREFGREAREANKGLWALGDEGTTKGDLDSKAVSGSSSNTGKSGSNDSIGTAGNSTSSESGSESYQNCTELRKVYPNGVPSTHPAYDSKHDRDKDNYACER
ncbi:MULTISPECIES: thermonuclease family protein [Cytobacillus]|uniref:Thermonuclease family protein n=1 Tax=Cytobacillus firmus TaxID=1399 RepID=A0AA46SKB3_CYTFI|nr:MULTISPECIES: thermonuclease family protein [Cytobacillus]MCS0652618.1 thermonuclease family protein [Cytobacillus firmus]MCU1804186.1 thermonuclease family protein [Cytobacillus firmus]UYG96114.1 thermonuclease family protein [Cytobacillus firmus]